MPNNAIQLWSPDTCDCVIHTAYDDRLPPDQRVFTYVTRDEAEAIVKARRDAGERHINPNPQPAARLCLAHAAIGFTPSLFTAVLDENRRKNITLGSAQQMIVNLKGEHYNWHFDDNRVLQISFNGITLSQAQKNQLQSSIDIQFGIGRGQIN